MILLTTSRKPSRRTRRFCRELSSVIPYSLCVNRGKASVRTVAERAVADGYSHVLFVLETKGNPSAIRVLHADPSGWAWIGQMYISGVSLALDRGERLRRIRADGLCVRADTWKDVLEKVFVPNCDDNSVFLIEKNGSVHFEYSGRMVGPRFEVTGWDVVPTALER